MTEQEKHAVCLLIAAGRETEIDCQKAARTAVPGDGNMISALAYGVAAALIPSRLAEIPDKDAIYIFTMAMGIDPRDTLGKALGMGVLPVVNDSVGETVEKQLGLIDDGKELEMLRKYTTERTLPLLEARIAEVTVPSATLQ